LVNPQDWDFGYVIGIGHLLQNGTFDKPIQRPPETLRIATFYTDYVTVQKRKTRVTMARASVGGLSVAATPRHDKIT
jgi:hypothetical protein